MRRLMMVAAVLALAAAPAAAAEGLLCIPIERLDAAVARRGEVPLSAGIADGGAVIILYGNRATHSFLVVGFPKGDATIACLLAGGHDWIANPLEPEGDPS